MKTHVMRHGDWDFEPERVIKEGFFFSPPLNEKGVQRVEQTAERVKEIHPTAIFHSPVLRCIQTTTILLRQKVKTSYMISIPELRSIEFPEEGKELIKIFSDPRANTPDWIELWFEEKYDMESPLNFLRRNQEAFFFIKRICQNYCLAEPILIVAHGETICACRHLFGLASFKEEIKKFPDFCEIEEFEI